MTTNKLKGELIIQSSLFDRQDIYIDHIQVETDTISPSLSVHNLGVVFERHLTMENHVWKVRLVAYYYLRNISSIQKSLTHHSVVALIHALMSWRLVALWDFAKSVGNSWNHYTEYSDFTNFLGISWNRWFHNLTVTHPWNYCINFNEYKVCQPELLRVPKMKIT